MKEEDFKYASLESLYRAPLGAFIKSELEHKAANIYIDAPVEDRASRELQKVNAKAAETGAAKITLEEMVAKVNEKDRFKIERRATDVRDIADYIVDNSKNVTKEQFLQKIDSIAQSLGVKVPKK